VDFVIDGAGVGIVRGTVVKEHEEDEEDGFRDREDAEGGKEVEDVAKMLGMEEEDDEKEDEIDEETKAMAAEEDEEFVGVNAKFLVSIDNRRGDEYVSPIDPPPSTSIISLDKSIPVVQSQGLTRILLAVHHPSPFGLHHKFFLMKREEEGTPHR
jgi:hypothetical protein